MRSILLILLFPLSMLCHAQIAIDSTNNVVRLAKDVDRLLDQRDLNSRKRSDTLYRKRAPERLRLKANVNVSGSDIIAEGRIDGGKFKTVLEAQMKYTLSLSASYRGLSLGAALNPAKFAGKNKDYEFNMNAYGNRVGADVIFQSANTYKGTVESGGEKVKVPTGLVRQNMLYVDAYYAFNAKRFSYPAAFTQSWIQLKSCGSLMLGLSLMGGNLQIKHSEELDNTAKRLSMANMGVGVGYGHNFVVKRKWLIHVSSLPQVVLISRCHTTVGDRQEKTPYRFPNIIAVGRIAVVRHFERSFMGFSAVVNTSMTGDLDQLRLHTVKWRARMFYGVKF